MQRLNDEHSVIADKQPDAAGGSLVLGQAAERAQALEEDGAHGRLRDYAERVMASVRAKFEHPFRVLKLQFSYRKVRYRELAKNTAQLQSLVARTNLCLAWRKLPAMAAWGGPTRCGRH